MRLTALQICPMLRNERFTPSATARSRSASVKTTMGVWPPSSRISFFRSAAAWRMRCWPTSVEPVKAIMRVSGWVISASPTVELGPVTTLMAPAGNPASPIMAQKSVVASGALRGGLTTTVQPAASAGATFQAVSDTG